MIRLNQIFLMHGEDHSLYKAYTYLHTIKIDYFCIVFSPLDKIFLGYFNP